MLNESALFALAIAHKEAIGANIAATCSACLAFFAEALLTVDTLAIETKVPLFTLLALESIITPLTINVHIVGTEFAEAIFDERSFNTTLVGEGVHAKQDTRSRNDHGNHEDPEKIIAARRALETRSSLQVVIIGLSDFEDEHLDHHLTAASEH